MHPQGSQIEREQPVIGLAGIGGTRGQVQREDGGLGEQAEKNRFLRGAEVGYLMIVEKRRMGPVDQPQQRNIAFEHHQMLGGIGPEFGVFFGMVAILAQTVERIAGIAQTCRTFDAVAVVRTDDHAGFLFPSGAGIGPHCRFRQAAALFVAKNRGCHLLLLGRNR